MSLLEIIDFGTIQKSIIQFQYNSLEELFIYYDDRSKKRMQYVE